MIKNLKDFKDLAIKDLDKAIEILKENNLNCFYSRKEMEETLHALINQCQCERKDNMLEESKETIKIAVGVNNMLNHNHQTKLFIYYQEPMCETIEQIKMLPLNNYKDIFNLLDYLGV